MAKEQAPRKSVYLHCSSVFTGSNARVRKTKSVRKLVEKNKHSFGALTHEYDLGTICNVVKELLDAGVFESASKAQAQFPELFQSSDGSWEESEPSDFEATKSEADAMEAMISSEEENIKKPDVLDPKISQCGKSDLKTANDRTELSLKCPTIGSRTLNLPPATLVTPNLHPISLPYKTQHRLLTIIQVILEECCFDFGRLWLPEVLKARSCECVESIELTRWTRILVRYCKDLPSWATTEIPGVSFRDVLFKTHQIRHTAVHRQLVSVCEVKKMIESAASLTTVLKDTSRSKKIRLIQTEVVAKIKELERVQNELETKMSEKLTAIAHRRALLDELEKKEIELMLSGGNQNRLRLGSVLDEFLIHRQICTESALFHPEETSRAEWDDATLKLEDLEGKPSSSAASLWDKKFHVQGSVNDHS